MTTEGGRRRWVPDIDEMARQLIEDYRREDLSGAGVGGDSASLATLVTWQQLAAEHGEQITENDLVALVQRLARIAAEQA